jgi:hypothetical protein
MQELPEFINELSNILEHRKIKHLVSFLVKGNENHLYDFLQIRIPTNRNKGPAVEIPSKVVIDRFGKSSLALIELNTPAMAW